MMFFLLSISGESQESITWSLTTEDNLPTNIVYEIHQDSLGQIWMATDNGVCLYDGHQVKSARLVEVNDHFFASMETDKFGRIWCLNISGELFYNTADLLVKIHPPEIPSSNYINEIIIIGDLIWIHAVNNSNTSDYYSFKINKRGSLQFLKKHGEFSSRSIVNFVLDSTLFLVTHQQKEQKSSIIRLTEKSSSVFTTIKINYLQIIGLSKDTLIELNHNESKLKLLINGKTTDQIKFSSHINRVKKIKNNLYILMNSGYHVINIQKDKLLVSEQFFPSLSINDIFFCRENNTWLATNNQGLKIINTNENLFYKISDNQNQSINISALSIKGDSLLMGSKNGKLYLAKNKAQIEEICDSKFKINQILHFNEDVFLGNSNGVFSLTKGKLKKKTSQGVKDFEVLDENKFAVSTYTSFYISNLRELNKLPENQILNQRSYSVEMDKDSLFWIGNVSGLFIFDKKESKLKSTDPLIDKNISDIIHYDNETSFVSTFANGIYKIKNQTEVIKIPYTIEKILDLDLNQEYLAVASTNEVGLFSIPDLKLKVITNKMLGNKSIQCIALDDEYLYVGTNGGYCKVGLNKQTQDTEIKFSIKQINVDNQVIQNTGDFKINHNSKNLTITFAGISFNNTSPINYEYRLVGLDTTWKETSFDRITYTALPPGKYTFEAFAKDGIYAQSVIQQIPFTIKKPWYDFWYVRLIAILIFGFLVYYFTRYLLQKRIEEEKLRVENQKKIDGMKMTALQNQMNPHFISNVLYSIHDLIGKEKTWEAAEYTSNFADIIRRSMEYATMERITLEQEIAFLKVYIQLETKRFEIQINTELICSEFIEKNKTKIYIPPLLIQPIIENSFKHAGLNAVENPLVGIKLYEENNKIICIVSDNGLGLSQKNHIKKKSTGLKTIEERLILNAKQLQRNTDKKIDISSNPNNGTIITLQIDFEYD